MLERTRGVELFLRQHQARPGLYREVAPARDLRDIVACNWVSVVRQGRFGARMPIIPDGCSDILLFDADLPVVVGPDTRMRWADLPEGMVITGLRLRPGALRAVFGCSASELVDRTVRLHDIAPVSTHFLDSLNFSDSLQRRHALLEEWVRRARASFTVSDAMVLAACRMIAADPQLPVGTLARRLGWNARTIQRQFGAACGYGPKHMQRVMRIQTALRVAHDSAGRMRASDIATAAGFADQAHMTRDFRDLTGFTPTAYLDFHNTDVGSWLAADVDPAGVSESFKTARR